VISVLLPSGPAESHRSFFNKSNVYKKCPKSKAFFNNIKFGSGFMAAGKPSWKPGQPQPELNLAMDL
jgi:hypothetical protein